jgi:long-subunit fatty acid transport protein
MKSARLTLAIAALFVGLGWSTSAAASPFELYGAGARGTAMAGAQVASGEGPGAVFYNVGALTGSPLGIHGSLLAGIDQSEILLMPRPDGYDVPDLGGSNPAVPSSATGTASDTGSMDPFYALSLGAVTSLSVDGLRVGAHMMVPIDGFFHLQTHFPDERERLLSNQLHHTLVGERVRSFDLQLGVAYELLPWLSVGAGGMFMVGAEPRTNAFIEDLGDQNDVDINADVETKSDWGLLLGAKFDLPANLTAGLSYRSSSAFQIVGENRIRLGTEGPDDEQFATQELNWTPVYTPEAGSIGLSWANDDVTVEASGRYTRWSKYVDTHSNETDFSDTLSPRLGAEWRYDEGLRVRTGFAWEPSPIPEQTGRTNYVDNERIIGALGAGHMVDALGESFEVNWSIQIQAMIPRQHRKERLAEHPNCGEGVTAVCDEVPDSTSDPRTGQPYDAAQGLQTGNPGFPGYSSGGWMGALRIEIAWMDEDAEGAE